MAPSSSRPLAFDSDGSEGCLSVFPLRGDTVLLRPLMPEHATALCEVANSPLVSAWTQNIPYPYRPEDAAAFLADTHQAHTQGRSLRLAIERAGKRSFLGMIGLELLPESGQIELGYWLGQEFWGQGYGHDALRCLLAHAFEDLKLSEVFAEVAVENIASQRLLEKVGFVRIEEVRRVFPHQDALPLPCYRYGLSAAQFAEKRQSRLLLVTAVALLDSDNRVLLQQRPLDKHMGGLWEFPGGKVDPGETPERALVRELHEELGIDVRESCLAPLSFASHAYDGFHLLMPLYLCRSWKGQVQGKEGQKLAWVRGNKLGDYPMPPADIPLIPILREWL